MVRALLVAGRELLEHACALPAFVGWWAQQQIGYERCRAPAHDMQDMEGAPCVLLGVLAFAAGLRQRRRLW